MTWEVMPRDGGEFQAGVYAPVGNAHLMIAECYTTDGAELIASDHNKIKELEKLITDAGLCIGSEYAGDLQKMVEYLIGEAKKPLPRRILEAEAQRDELLACAKGSRVLIGKFQEYLKEEGPIPMLEALDRVIAKVEGK